MKYLVIILVVSIFNLCLAACQSEPATPEPVTFVPPPVTLSSGGDPATGENENTQPPAGGSDVAEEIIDETQQTVGATATLPPPPKPTLTPTPDNNNEASGAGGDGSEASGGNEVDTNSTQSFTDVTINSGAYEGAILETQLNFGGGEGEYLCIGKDGLIENIYGDMSIEELIANGCELIDGQPVVVANPGNGPANKRANNKFWADDLIRQVFWNFNPFEDIKVLFYEHEFDSSTIGSLIGWLEIQVDEDGFFLLKTTNPSSLSREYLEIVVLRSNGQLITEAADSIDVIMDEDHDGLSDEEEVASYGTDPLNPDTDGDGRQDGEEVFSLDTDPNNPMNVDDITQVTYQGGGQFVQQAGTDWIEYNNDGQFFFQENSRDPWSIYLYDASRDLNIQLDFWTREVICSGQDCTGVLYLIEGFSRGRACPFVFTYDAAAQAWTFDTTIIYKLVGPESEQLQWRELRQFDGRLLIREVEPEISFLDQVYVVVVDQDGQETILVHDFPPLQTADDEYFIMHQGDEFELTFSGYEELANVSQAWVVAEGYYEPLGDTP